MKRILLLGGIGEARRLARRLAPKYELAYSLAGRARKDPDLACAVRVGGFGGVAGLADFLREGGFELLIDATHPYAARISRQAAQAAKQAGVPIWAYRRPPWRPAAEDDWRTVGGWPELSTALHGFRRPFFTIGLEPLDHAGSIPPAQHWLVRCLETRSLSVPRLAVLGALGPFTLEEELASMQAHDTDVLVSKNSGGSAVAAKLEAARLLRIPVLMLTRPELPPVDREFDDSEALAAYL